MTEQQNNNPLQKYFRQPKLYISLPSNGKFYNVGSLEKTETQEYPVYSMTAKDELAFKTPDALLNGQATVDVIQSCVPNIKNAWMMPSIDLDAVLIAIRMATYGDKLSISTKTPVIGDERDYELDLRLLYDGFSNLEFDETVEVGDMKIHIRPLTYREFTKNAVKTFEEQRIFSIVNDESINDQEKLQAFTNSFTKLTELTINTVIQSISKISLEDTEVTNPLHIEEFIKNADKDFFSAIISHIEAQKEKYTIKPLKIQATPEDIEKGVPEVYEVPITFDQSNFFG